ncbi:MAG TPA: YceI family protein [Paracoccus sp. (in: a-proteobacteria)]|uniref:YceI family protein n=1 Tax=Paracoccus sp. TaxID=267 RepID=UPI002B808E98|nr:YceI family protein [Paracoccus sp. (in: a-proteobacteria)]HWL56664.1 YceI family protein [Paracoccus sp. (in: a-proteobacteria)]
MKSLLAPLAAFSVVGATAAFAEPVAYDFDPSHSQVVFEYGHMGFSTSTGIINGVTGKLMLDAENPANSSVEATIPLSGLRTVSADLDKHLFGADFFDTDQGEAVATFKSTKVEPDGDKEAKVTGDFTLNGVTKTIVLDIDLNQVAAHPMTGKEAAGFDGETKINRSEFNLGKFAPAVEDEVEVSITVEAIKAG